MWSASASCAHQQFVGVPLPAASRCTPWDSLCMLCAIPMLLIHSRRQQKDKRLLLWGLGGASGDTWQEVSPGKQSRAYVGCDMPAAQHRPASFLPRESALHATCHRDGGAVADRCRVVLGWKHCRLLGGGLVKNIMNGMPPVSSCVYKLTMLKGQHMSACLLCLLRRETKKFLHIPEGQG